MNESQQKLHELLERVFEDSLVDVEERNEIAKVTASGDLSQDEIHRVFVSFLHKKWGEAMKDDVLTPQERGLLLRIIRELGITRESLPEQARIALGED